LVGWVAGWLVNMGLAAAAAIYSYLMYKDLVRVKAGATYEAGKGKGWVTGLAIIGLIVPTLFWTAALILLAINPAAQQKKAREFERIKEQAGNVETESKLGADPIGQARDIKRKGDVVQIGLAAEMYYVETGSYPTESAQLVPDYLTEVPRDPGGIDYEYVVDPETGKYQVCATLEDASLECQEARE